MRSRALTYFVVGAFAFAASFAIWRAVLFVRKGGGGEGYKLYAYFSDATGLVEKSRVQMSGLAVGQITERRLVDEPPRPELIRQRRFARITIQLDPDTVIYENAVVIKKALSLLGEFYLEIDPGDPRDPATGKPHKILKAGDEIRFAVGAVTTDDMLRRMEATLPTLQRIAEDVRELTRPGGPIAAIAENVRDTTATVAENRDKITELLDHALLVAQDLRGASRSLDRNTDAIVQDVQAITGSLRQMIASPDGQLQRSAVKLDQTMERLQDAIARLDATLAHTSEITATINSGEGNLGRLVHDDTLVRNVEEVTGETGRLIKQITRLRTIVGLRSEYNLLAATVKSYVAIAFAPKPDKYYLLEFVDDPRGSTLATQRFVMTDDPELPARTRTEEIEVREGFRFTFQFAKRLQFRDFGTTLRFGIKESSGGLGADLHLLRNKLELVNDVFDPSANRFPRVKTMLAWEFFKHLYVVGGLDDVLNDRPATTAGSGRDYFLGAQIRFDDEDLFGMLFTGGSTIGGGAASAR